MNVKIDNLEYMCTIIEYIAKMRFSPRSSVVKSLGIEGLCSLYENADSWGCQSYQATACLFVDKYNVSCCAYEFDVRCDERALSPMDFGDSFAKLIIDLSNERNENFIQTAYDIYLNSFFEVTLESASMYAFKNNKQYRLKLYKGCSFNKIINNNKKNYLRKINRKDYAIKKIKQNNIKQNKRIIRM